MPLRPAREVRRDDRIPTNLGLPVRRRRRLLRLVLATGFLGGFSTFSTAINEMVTLFRKHRYPTAAAYLVLSLGVPVVAAACGFLV